MFMPVHVSADPLPALPAPSSAKAITAEDTRIEIELPDGTCVRVGAQVGLATLRRIMTAVRR